MEYIYRNELIDVKQELGINLISVAGVTKDFQYLLTKPMFEVDGKECGGSNLQLIHELQSTELRNGGKEFVYEYSFLDVEHLKLKVQIRCFPNSPFVRYKYILNSNKSVSMTKSNGRDNIHYSGFSSEYPVKKVTEIQFSQFESLVHSFTPNFEEIDINQLEVGASYVGPISVVESEGHACLIAYEHGAEYPDSYLNFHAVLKDGKMEVKMDAVKGNYYTGQVIDEKHSFESPWFHFAACRGSMEELLKHYRNFLMNFICENTESRKPYIFYNTWNFQERDHHLKGIKYHDGLDEERVLREIELAHKMGIDVFVIDVPWFIKTGDWDVDLLRFPNGMKKIKNTLNSYGMKLGLWFNPNAAALTSNIAQEHPEYATSIDGKIGTGPVWDTEDSYGMCLASNYSDFFIEKLVECNKIYGVTYFKWDAIWQNSCSSPLHNHGNEIHSEKERMECFNFKMGMEMIRIVDELTKRCPEAIVDFDVTEGGRFVGLGFLSVGKYFLMNNGPYCMDFDWPEHYNYLLDETIRIEPWTNVFFYPGAARSKVCRQGLKYDSFVPSILFLTHFLPDKPRFSQNNALASLMLGGNGIWGDLTLLNDNDISVFAETLGKYKKVADSVNNSYPRVKGFIGSSPEIYEKIDHEKAEGLVCFFTRGKGEFEYVTDVINTERFSHVDGADTYEVTAGGRLKIKVSLNQNDAKYVFVFAKQ